VKNINEELKKLQSIELDMLQELKKICTKHDLKYYIIGGTLLGAKRHGGFIPWDDDIDVAMPRKDYDSFISIAKKELVHPYKINHYTLEDSDPTKYVAGVVNSDVIVYEDRASEFSQNLWIDILPIDALPNSWLGMRMFKFRTYYYRALSGFVNIDKIRNIKRKWYEVALIKFAQIIPIGKILNLFKIRIKMDKMFRKQNYLKANFVGTFLGRYGFHEVVPKSYFGEGTMIEFEGIPFNAPEKLEEYLTHMYGDYMQLPPEDKRNPHIVKVEYKNKRKEEK